MPEQHHDRSTQVPAVDFYGDTSAWPMSELVHSEPLVERSELHDWKIRPHRHSDLTQLFLVLDGNGRARFDSIWHDLAAPCLLIVPKRVVHEFEWECASGGYVLSIRSSLVESLARQMKPIGHAFQYARVVNIVESLSFIRELFIEIHAECVDQRPLRDASLENLIRVLAIWLTRNSETESAAVLPIDRGNQHLARFTRLVDEQHKAHWTVAEYTNAIGITASHLNATCRKLADKSALEVIHARLLLAARRQLVYTERNIAGIAHYLGFADPSYFTRFFKRETGMTPGEYRKRSGTFEA